MHMTTDRTRLFRVPLLCLLTLMSMSGFVALASASSDGSGDEFTIGRNGHGNTGGLLLLREAIFHRQEPDQEESQEARDIIIPVLSPPRLQLDLFIPLNRIDLVRDAKVKRVKPRVVRRIKFSPYKRRR